MKRFIPLMVGMLTIISIIQFRVVVAVDDEKPDSEINDSIPELYIKAINPGYTIDGKSNTGEMIEIARKKPGSLISLAGVTVRYTNSSGNTSTLLEFPENSYLAGEAVLLRLASSPESELANLNYSKTLAMKGGIELAQGEEVMDKVCWTGKGECYKEFVSAHPTTLIRNLITGEFEHSDKPMAKSANMYLKYYISEAASIMILHNSIMKNYYQNKYSEVKSHQHKRALALSSRKLIRLIFGLLCKNQLYVPSEFDNMT